MVIVRAVATKKSKNNKEKDVQCTSFFVIVAPQSDMQYPLADFEDIEHAYAITVHKSQGSEYPIAVIPLSACAPMLQTRNMLYTAITRARTYVILVGSKQVLENMVNNDSRAVRYSGLAGRICELIPKE